MASDIEKLIDEQRTGTELDFQSDVEVLAYLNKFDNYLQDLFIETEIVNENLTKVSDTVANIGKDLVTEINGLVSAVTNIKMPEIEAPVDDFDARKISLDTTMFKPIDKVAEYFNNQDLLAKEISNVRAFNEAEAKRHAQKFDEFNKSFEGKVANLFAKIDPNNLHEDLAKLQAGPVEMVEPQLQDPSAFYASLDSNTEKSLFLLTNIDRNIDEQLQMAKAAEEAKDVGGLSGFGDGKDTQDDEGPADGIIGTVMDLLGFGKGKKGKPGGGKIMKKFGKFGKALKGIGKALGKAFVVLEGFLFVKDLFDGFTDNELIKDITGKSKEDLTGAEQSASSIANALSGLTLGLLPVRDTFEALTSPIEMLQKGIDHLFDPEIGIFGKVTQGIFDLVDGNFMQGFQAFGDALLDIPAKLLDKASDIIKNLLGMDVDLKGGAMKQINKLKDVGSSVVKSVGGFFGFGDDEEEKEQSSRAETFGPNFMGSSVIGAPSNSDILYSSDQSNATPMQSGTGGRLFSPVSTANQSSAKAMPSTFENRSVQLSKQRLDEDKKVVQSNPQPIVIQQPAQQQKSQVVRRTSVDDMGLAMMNSNMMDA